VFAQIVGTIQLLELEEQRRIKATIINKFRGDKELLKPGLEMLEAKTQTPVCGVVPYFYLDIDDEDSLTERFHKKVQPGLLDIVVIRVPRISNFTDFMALECMDEVSLRYVESVAEIGNPDAILLPGSKNTIEDLLWMRQNGLEAAVKKHSESGKLVFGICGGYQMLGQEIYDPLGVEREGAIPGMGLLPVRTRFEAEKTRTRVTGTFSSCPGLLYELGGIEAEGYEIHMGTTEFIETSDTAGTAETISETASLLMLQEGFSDITSKTDGSVNARGNVYGCYVHGIFDRPQVSQIIVSALLRQKGLDPASVKAIDMKQYKEDQYNQLADIIRANLDMASIYEIVEKGNKWSCSQLSE